MAVDSQVIFQHHRTTQAQTQQTQQGRDKEGWACSFKPTQLSDLQLGSPTGLKRLPTIRSPISTMILYLLFLALILGKVESQTANMTKEEKSKVERNQTFSESVANNSTMKLGYPTPSLDKDERSLIEEELQNNQTWSVITEDDESFQDQEDKFQGGHCQEKVLEEYSHSICGENFHTQMMSISTEDWCVMENIIRPYNDMTVCLEELSFHFGCYHPHPVTQDFFLSVHSSYFHSCSKKELSFEDAPHGLVVALTLISVSLIPVLVYLVVRKRSVQV